MRHIRSIWRIIFAKPQPNSGNCSRNDIRQQARKKAVTWPRISIPRLFKWVGAAVLCVSILSAFWYLNLRPLYAFFSATQVQGDAGRIPATSRALDLKVAQFARARNLVGFQKSILNEVGMAFRALAPYLIKDAERLPDFIHAMRVNSNALINAHPLNPFYYYRRAQVEQEIAKDSNQSASYLKQAIALSPSKGIFRFQLGIVYLQADKISEARELFLELKREEWYPGAMDFYLAVADFLEGELMVGKKSLLSALATYDPTGVEWNMLAGAYLVHGKPADLLVWFERISKIVGSNERLSEIMRILKDMTKEPQPSG